MPDAAQTDLVGRRLGHYRVDSVIGHGGMSTLYRATDLRLGRAVALKIMSDALADDAEFRERFVDEARNTSALDHPHVVPLYDFGDLDGMLFLAMRYVEGVDIAQLLADGPLSPRRVIALLAQVADALDALHARNLVHLDIKPANILVSTRTGSGVEHVYLADFGLTRRGSSGQRTANGDFLGSPTYAAPEHLRGERVDARTDVYSLACVLVACLTGHAPFRGTVDEVIAGHLAGRLPVLSNEVSLPQAIDEVVHRGMAALPAARPGSCGQLVELARAALAAAPQDVPPARRVPGTGPAGGDAGSRSVGHASLGSAGRSGYVVPGQVAGGPQWSGRPDAAAVDAMKVRTPAPTHAGNAFVDASQRPRPWVLPLLVGLSAVLVVLLVIAVLTS